MDTQKFYVTKHWNNQGILCVSGKLVPCTPTCGKTHMLSVRLAIYGVHNEYYRGNEYFATKEEALAYVEEQRKRQIESLRECP
jgi:hypothetical protein